jgi:drug/metabolite transporter (DMT)-like permease
MPSTEPSIEAIAAPPAEPRSGDRHAGTTGSSSTILPFLLLTLTSLLWAGNWVVGRSLRDAMPPIALTFWRWAGAALILAPFVLPRLAGRWHRVLPHWRLFLLLGGTGAALFQALVYVGLGMTTTINAVLMNSSVPLFILLCSWLIEREAASLRQIAGVAVSFVGILAIMLHGDLAQLLHLEINRGDAVILAAMPAWGIYCVVLKRRPSELTGVEFLFILALSGSLCLTPFFIAENLFIRRGTLSLETFAGGVYVSLCASVLGYICWNKGVEMVGANRAGFTIHLLPAFGTLLAILLLGEAFHLYHLVGIATILAGVFLATSAPRRAG